MNSSSIERSAPAPDGSHSFTARIVTLTLLTLTLLTAQALLAQPQPTTSDTDEDTPAATVEGGEIVVTSTLPDLFTELDVEGDRLKESGQDDVAAALRDLRGLSSVRRGTINLEPIVRGLQETQVGLFVDGTRTFAAGPARMDSGISHVNPHHVRNLRIVKGPYALTWGSGALSAVELELQRPAFSADGFRWQGDLGAAYGENGDRADVWSTVGGGGERFRFAISGGYREGGDYEAGDGTEIPGDYESTDLRFRFGWNLDDSLDIDWSGGYQEQFDLDYPGRILDATYFYTRSQAVALSWTGGATVDEVYGQIYVNRKDHRMNNDEKPTAQPAPGRIPPFALRVDLPTESNTSGGRFRVRFQRGDVDWTVGADAYTVEQNALREVRRRDNDFLIFSDVVWPDAEIDDFGGYAQAVWNRPNAKLGFGVRVDAVDATAGDLSPFFLANTVGDPDQSETNFSAALSATFELASDWLLRAGVGRAVRSPTVLERYSDRFPATKFQLAAEFMGNPELEAETATELDLGLETRRGRLGFQVDVFYREIDDYITVIADPSLPRRLPLSPPVVYRYLNGSQATFWGGELRLDVDQDLSGDSRLHWRAELSWVRGDDDFLDEPVLGLAPLHGTLGMRWHGLDQRLWIDLAAHIYDRQDRVASSRFEQPTPGYNVIDLGAGWRIADDWSLDLRVANLADEDYAAHLNAPNPFTRQRLLEIGRSVRLGFELRY